MTKKLNKKRVAIAVIVVLILASISFYLVYRGSREPNTSQSPYQTYVYSGPGGDYLFTIVPDEEGEGVRHLIEVMAGNAIYKYPLRYGPKELEEITISGDVKERLLFNADRQKTTLYITQDPDLVDKTDSYSAIAVIDINSVTGSASYGAFKINTITAVTRETTDTIRNNLPVITCEDSDNNVGVIELRLGLENKISQEENGCVILEGVDAQGILKVADKLILNMLGVF